jgi:F-type H+-transporting ATPase subunit gamma
VIASNRGLAGAYNGNVLRKATVAIRQQEAAGNAVDLYVSGKKAVSSFNFQRRPITRRVDVSDPPRFGEIRPLGEHLMRRFIDREVDAVHVVYMNFISTGVQKPDVLTLLPLIGLKESMEHLSQQVAEKEAQMKAGALDARRTGADVRPEADAPRGETVYDFSPEPKVLLDELLPLTVNSALYQAYLDAATSEHVARMVSMKSATDNADKMVKALTMKYNRARQSQITTELSEIMGGVEAMKK